MLTIDELQEAASRTAHEVREMHQVSRHVVALLEAQGDEVGADQLVEVAQHSTLDELSLVFAGEHKSGKSSLINAILGERIVDTNPLGTTAAILEVRQGERDARYVVLAQVDENGEEETVKVEIDHEQFLELQREDDPHFDGVPVAWLEAELDHPLLSAGLVLIDTPSISGGMQSPAAGEVLGRISYAHGLVFVTDVSQELTGPELDFIEVAATLCPYQLVVATKTDLYPEWHRMVTVNVAHLEESRLDDAPAVLAVANPLRWASIRLADAGLDRESGVPLLVWYLGVTVLTEARLAALRIAAEVTEDLAAEMVVAARQRLDVLAGTSERRELEEHLGGLRDRYGALVEEKQYGFELQEALAEFSSAVESDLQWRMTEARASTRDRLADLTGPQQWSRFEAELHGTWNELFAKHLAFVPEAINRAFDQLREQLELELHQIDVRSLGDQSVRGELDRPGKPSSTADMSLRLGITSASGGGGGVATLAGVFGVGAFMTAGVAVMGGAVVGGVAFLVSRGLGKRRSQEQWRHMAEREVNEYHESVGGSIQSHSRRIQSEVPNKLRREFTKAIEAEGARTRTEIDRLTQLLEEAQGRTDESEEAARGESRHAELVHSHARRLGFRLRLPELVDR